MQKQKFFIFGMAALLGASLFLIGCPTDAADGTNGTNGAQGPISGHYAGEVSVQALTDAVAKGWVIQLDDATITGGGTLDLRGADVTVYGKLETKADSAAVYILAGSSVKLAEGASIEPGEVGDYFFGVADHAAAKGGSQSSNVSVVSASLPTDAAGATAVGGVTAVENLTLDESVTTDPAWYALSLKVFVYGTLTVKGKANAPGTATVTALKNVVIEAPATATDTISTLSEANKAKVDVSAATIGYSGTATVKVALPTALSSPAFSVTGEGGVLEVSGSTTVNARVGPGNGLVKFTEAVTTVAITGAGNVAFSETLTALQGTITAKTAAFADAVTTAAALTIDADLTTFDGAVEIATGAATFNGKVVFKDDLTLTAVGAAFKGPAFFADGTVISLSAATSVITLKPGAGLAHGDATKIPAVYSAILGNIDDEDNVTLTPGVNTTLTFGAAAAKSITQAGTAGHSIKIGGKAALIASATYTVASESGKVGTLELDTDAELHIDDGVLLAAGAPAGYDNDPDTSAKLVLTGASGTDGAVLKGAGTVAAGGTEIVGGTNGWQAVGASTTVAITADAITGTGTDAELVAGTSAGAITIGGNTVAGPVTLTVTGLAVNVLTSGSIAIPYPASGAANVFKLANNAAFLKGLKITGSTGTTIGITNATVVGTATVGTSGSAAAENNISGTDADTAATITGAADTNDVTIDNTTSVTAAAS